MEEYQDQAPDFNLFGFFNHGVPALLLTLDWASNSMVSDLRMLPFLILLATAYLGVNTLEMLHKGKAIYPTHDWYNSPGMAIVYSLILYTLLVVSFLVFYSLTKCKLRSFKGITSVHAEGNLPTDSNVEGDSIVSHNTSNIPATD